MDNAHIDNTVQFNDQKFYFKVFLINGKGQFFSFTSSSIKELIISDDMFNFYIEGSLVFSNTFDALERAYVDNDNVINEGYSFNVSDRDYLYIEIIPKVGEQAQDALNPEVWNLQYNCVITDIEDIVGESPTEKYKKLYFHEDVYQIMLEKNLEFSSSLILLDENKTSSINYNEISPSQRIDEDRMHYTGDIIKELIKTGIGNDSLFDKDWDRGSRKMFYTSNPSFKMINDMKYVLNRHVSGEDFLNDFSLLNYGRYTKKWQLKPFFKTLQGALYQNNKSLAGIEQLERFSIVEIGETSDTPIKNSIRVPSFHEKGLTFNMFFGEYSLIDKYTLHDMSLLDRTSLISTHIAHSYDYYNKNFLIKHSDNDINETKKFFSEIYANQLKSPNYNNFSLFNVDNIRKTNQNVRHVFGCGYESNNPLYNLGRNQILKNNIILNTSIDFTVRGLTHRKSGKFFSISKDNAYNDSEYESKLQGQWLLVKVEHVFTEDAYTNNIIGVKLNKFREV